MPERLIPDPEILICPACGRENPASHKFCGMCGREIGTDRRLAADRVEQDTEPRHADQEPRSEAQPFEHSITNPNELSLFRSFRPSDGSESDYWQEETRSPYRILVGLVIALMIAGLAYMAWRTSKGGQNARDVLPAPVTTEKSAAPPSTSPAPAPAPEASASKPAEPATNAPAPTPKNTGKVKPDSPKRTANAAPAKPARSAEPVHTQDLPDNGSAELAEARRYLAVRDNSDAAKWLWKSIAKHNGEATVALADLYLKGEGVSKNCDQARVLLDSAARKGVAGAGERLRNLPAFGCQ